MTEIYLSFSIGLVQYGFVLSQKLLSEKYTTVSDIDFWLASDLQKVFGLEHWDDFMEKISHVREKFLRKGYHEENFKLVDNFMSPDKAESKDDYLLPSVAIEMFLEEFCNEDLDLDHLNEYIKINYFLTTKDVESKKNGSKKTEKIIKKTLKHNIFKTTLEDLIQGAEDRKEFCKKSNKTKKENFLSTILEGLRQLHQDRQDPKVLAARKIIAQRDRDGLMDPGNVNSIIKNIKEIELDENIQIEVKELIIKGLTIIKNALESA